MKPATKLQKDWYSHRSELKSGLVFKDVFGFFVKLDRRVPGDGTRWYVEDWHNGGWTREDNEVEPSDLTTFYPEAE